MKRKILRAVSYSIFVLGIFAFSVAVVSRILTHSALHSDKEAISAAINEYWRLSLLGTRDELDGVLTGVPADYYDNLNRCLKENGEIERRIAESKGGLIEISRGVTDDKRKYEYDDILRFASKIKDKNLSSYEITEISVLEDDAIVRVDYGGRKPNEDVILFLLKKVDDKWLIFLVNTKSFLEEDNPFYGVSKCSN